MTRRDLERLYDAHAAGLFHYLAGITRAEADAKDLLQEVFIKLAALEGAEEVRNEKPFLYRLAHNQAIDWLRRSQVRRNANERLARELCGAHQVAGDPDLQALALGFAAAMESLPHEQRTVVHLKLWEGLTFEEIAETQGIPLNTAASRYRYGIDKLRTLLRPIYEELQ